VSLPGEEGAAPPIDLRPLPLKHRKGRLAQVGEAAESWIALTNGIVGEERALYRAVVDADLEGIVAKHLADVYHRKLARWHKILNWAYSQRSGRAEWFRERRGRYPGPQGGHSGRVEYPQRSTDSPS
jgi:hypothetical protein